MPDTAAVRWRSNFKRILAEAGRNKSDVARKAGLSPQWATGVTTRNESLSLEAVDAIAKELGRDVAEFFRPLDLPRHSLGLESAHSPHTVSQGSGDAGTSSGDPEEALRDAINSVVHAVRLSQAADRASAPQPDRVRDPLPRRRRRHPKD